MRNFLVIFLSYFMVIATQNVARSQTTQPVTLRFAGAVNGAPFACGKSYPNIGTTKSTITPSDFRLFVSAIELHGFCIQFASMATRTVIILPPPAWHRRSQSYPVELGRHLFSTLGGFVLPHERLRPGTRRPRDRWKPMSGVPTRPWANRRCSLKPKPYSFGASVGQPGPRIACPIHEIIVVISDANGGSIKG